MVVRILSAGALLKKGIYMFHNTSLAKKHDKDLRCSHVLYPVLPKQMHLRTGVSNPTDELKDRGV